MNEFSNMENSGLLKDDYQESASEALKRRLAKVKEKNEGFGSNEATKNRGLISSD